MGVVDQEKRPHHEESDGDIRPRAPMRHSTHASGATATSHSTTKRAGSAGVAAAILKARISSRSSQQVKKQLDEEEKEVGDYYKEEEQPVVPTLRPQETQPGAVAVRGPDMDEENQLYASTATENANQDPTTDCPMPPGSTTQDPTQEPIEARCVSDNEDMHDQAKEFAEMVQKELMSKAAVPIEVHPSTQDISTLGTKDGGTSSRQQKKRNCLIAIAVLAIVAAVAVGVAVGVSKQDPEPSPTPAPVPMTTRAEAFQSALKPISGQLLMDETTPQYQALNWIANVDAANMTVGVDSDDTIAARYVAALLYFAFGGEGWMKQYNFLSEGDICTWNKDIRDGLKPFGISCGSDGAPSVDTIRLPENKLKGSFPSEIQHLSDLNNIDMAVNTIDGTLMNLEDLVVLKYLNLTRNVLTGTLPEFLFIHPHLVELQLDHNSLAGTISDSLGTSPQLQVFSLNNNTLTGQLPSLVGQSTSLGSIDLGFNQLTGTIPDFDSNSKISYLDLYKNNIGGSIPFSIGILSLTYLGISENQITGTIPSEISQCKNLSMFYLSNNAIEGSIPTEMWSLSSLEHLILDENRLRGPIPAELSMFKSLTYLGWAENFLTGNIGPLIDSFPPSLEFFDTSANNLNGTIPASIGALENLWFLDLWTNKIGGVLPSELGLLDKLKTLSLSHNEFIGPVPTSIASLPKLSTLHLHQNDFTGSLDAFCGTNLEVFSANTCEEPNKIECLCCNQCCRAGTLECDAI